MRNTPISELLAGVQLVAFDFDGVFTDGKVYVSSDGTETVCCSRRDSLGIEMLKRADIECFVVTKEPNEVVERRCQKMGISCFRDIKTGQEKAEIVARVAEQRGIPLEAVAYVGDDIQDIPALRIVGIPCAPSDAADEVLNIVRFVSLRKGGDHFVRDVCNQILKAKNIPLHI